MTVIKTVITDSPNLNVNEVFKNCKYAIPEMKPKKLSDGTWLHCYRITPYTVEDYIYGDQDYEEEKFYEEQL